MSQRTACLVVGTLLILGSNGPLVAESPPAFPNAVGFGTHTRAGRGGKILRVTTLKAQGPGSLRHALEAKGPRIVVFEVGGVIDLGKKSINVTKPFLTVAGQTAPSPGITVIRGAIYLHTHDLVIRHIRVRPGDAGEPKRSGWSPDGISTSGGACHDIVIDHCSLTWAVDENLTASGPRDQGPAATSHRITFSHCIIAEGLDDSSHEKGPHSKGTLIHDNCRDIAVIGNLYAHNVARNPYFKAFTTGVVVNNVIYNPGRVGVQVDYVEGEWRRSNIRPEPCRISVVGNVMFHGVDTRPKIALVQGRGDVYLKDSLCFHRDGEPAPLRAGRVKRLDKPPVWPKGLEPVPAREVVAYVCKHVGARPKDRDVIDRRIIRQLRERKGRIIDSQDDVGGYPKHAMTRRKLDVPEKNVDAWLAKMAQEVE